MKFVLIGIAIIVLGFWGSFWWAGRGLLPLDDAAQASAPGAFAELHDGRVHYQFTGPEDASLIVMVHGYSTPGFIFDQNAAALREAGFRVLQFDHFGRGWSDRPDARYDIDFYDRELTGLLDALSINQRVGLVGLSMGGPIVSEFAARHPERVSKVFLFVPAGFDVAGTSGTQAALIRTPIIGDWLWRMAAMKRLTSDPQYDESGLAPENRLQGNVLAQTKFEGYGRALLSTFRHFPLGQRDATYAALAATGIPVAAIFGDQDPTVLVSSAAAFSALLPDAHVHILEGTDHGLNYKRHTDVNPILTDWFAEPMLR